MKIIVTMASVPVVSMARLALLFVTCMSACAQPTAPAAGLSPYVTYTAGDCHLVFTAPHGGGERPSGIPDRTVCAGSYKGCKLQNGECDFSHTEDASQCQCSSSTCSVRYYSDSYTKEITQTVHQEIMSLTGKTPHMVVMELQRRKLDANREINEATFGDANATNAWDTFHHYIDNAKFEIGANPGLLFDIHGQSHSEGWTEFGYGISKSKIDSDTYTTSTRETYATICALVARQCDSNSSCFKDLVRLDRSLGERLTLAQDANGTSLGYTAIPSIDNPDSTSYNYYTGGYNVKEHGSRGCTASATQFDAVQIEIPSAIRFSSTERVTYAKALAAVIVKYMDDLYPTWKDVGV